MTFNYKGRLPLIALHTGFVDHYYSRDKGTIRRLRNCDSRRRSSLRRHAERAIV